MNLTDALCARVVTPDYDPFYAPEHEQSADRRVRENEAVAICEQCPALAACRRLVKADPELREHAVVAALRPTRKPVRVGRQPLTDDTRAAIRDEYAAGRSTIAIARDHDTATSTVSHICADLRDVRAVALERPTVGGGRATHHYPKATIGGRRVG